LNVRHMFLDGLDWRHLGHARRGQAFGTVRERCLRSVLLRLLGQVPSVYKDCKECRARDPPTARGGDRDVS